MRLTRYFLPILREAPAEAHMVSHQLMLRAGMVRQTSAGIYTWLPLGLRVLRKIENIIRQEQEKAGAIELLMPTLQPAQCWEQSGRYDEYGKEMLRITDRGGRALLYGPTNEELITQTFAHESKSWRDCERILYQIQWKFRDEIRPRFGVLRGREFLMKDGYSFDIDRAGAERAYRKMFMCYLKTFARLGVKTIPVRADTGPIGGNLSHEFIMLTPRGESEVYCDKALIEMRPPDEVDYDSDLSAQVAGWTRYYAAEGQKHDPNRFEKEVAQEHRLETKGIEVGHIFYFGEKYSKPFNALVATADGENRLLHSGSYGIGVSRLVGAVIEASYDDRGIVWPRALAPFEVGLLNLQAHDDDCVQASERLYRELSQAKLELLYDDRDERSGVKFALMDLIGCPYQIVVGARAIKQQQVEIKTRSGALEGAPEGALEGALEIVALDNVKNYLKDKLNV